MRSWLPLLLSGALLSVPTLVQAAPAKNAVGEILTRARATDALARVPRKAFYDGGQGSTLLVWFEFRVREDGLRVEFVEYKRSGAWKGERSEIGDDGALRSIELATGQDQREPLPEDVLKGTLQDGKLEFKTGQGEARTDLTTQPEGALVPMGLALLVLPAYYELLPEQPLEFNVMVSTEVMALRVSKGQAGEGSQEVLIEAKSGLRISVQVSTAAESRGKVLKLVIGDEEKKPLTPAEAKALLKQAEGTQGGFPSAREAVEALIAACQAKDLKAVGACFAPEAPGEFQTLRDGSCPPKKFEQLCAMFAGASVESVTPAESGRARVAVKLSKGSETLTMIQGPGGWLILDF